MTKVNTNKLNYNFVIESRHSIDKPTEMPGYKIKINNGFSLLELSITLTIISLIIAAISAGQNIKKQAQLQQVIADISTISSAYQQFSAATSSGGNTAMPGDFSSATGKFGNTSTDNGDGNGYLSTSAADSGTICAVSGNANEELMFWQHLQLAGLISGTYDCKTNGSGGLKATQIKNGFYQAHKLITQTGAAAKRLNIQVSKYNGTNGMGAGLFSTLDASAIDTKIDDGLPNLYAIANGDAHTSSIQAKNGGDYAEGTCVSTRTQNIYNTTNTTDTPCSLYFYIE
jgi:hypothetical protein